jgi:uncharacterized protein (TIGR02145 family)
MKNLIIICLFIISAFTANAQTTSQKKSFKSWEGAGSLMGMSGASAEGRLKQNKFGLDEDDPPLVSNGLVLTTFYHEDAFEYCVIGSKNGSIVLVLFNIDRTEDDYYGDLFDGELENCITSFTAAGFKSIQTTTEDKKEVEYFYNSNKQQKIRVEKHSSSEIFITIYKADVNINALFGGEPDAKNDKGLDPAEKPVNVNTNTEITIARQVWAVINLNTDHFRNGDIIPEAKTKEEWISAAKLGKPAWCFNVNFEANKSQYGKLYNWHAVNDPRGLAPAGWHVPSKDEVDVLMKSLGGAELASGKMKTAGFWANNGGGNNSSGFSAMPGGIRNESGDFTKFNSMGYFWTTTRDNTDGGNKYSHHFLLQTTGGLMNNNIAFLGYGFSVRCVKDGKSDEMKTIKYENGNIKSESHYVGGVLQGKSNHYYENGKLKQEGTYVNGKEDGVFKVYYENGKIKAIIPYSGGILQGNYFEYFEDGKLKMQYFYTKGVLSCCSPEYLELTKLAGEYNMQKNYNEAIRLYSKAIELNPTLASTYYNRGACKSQNADRNGAITDYDKAIEIRPDFMEAFRYRGFVKVDMYNDNAPNPTPEQIKGCCEDLNKAISLGDNSTLTEQVIAKYCK